MTKLALLGLLGLIGCSREPRAEAPPLGQTATVPVDVGHSTIVAYFVVTPDQIERNPQLVLSYQTFQDAVAAVKPEAQRRGIQFVVIRQDSLRLRWPDGTEETYATADTPESPIGYHFFKPGATPMTLPEEQTGGELLRHMVSYFEAPSSSPSE